ncbi:MULTISPECIES: hypothetical protein [Halobacteriovorax]|uniref:Uncharacterized protein n=1 Tax=Halobacteriovorax vibrionivorans TaxID=2152716 RepID=A0ABY0II27_9BACT|nr:MULTISPECIES: hypothetical protein [Halobacteriovorax]RZF20992.1 hypothetical protein DAY19_13490 [Halobacteriovorax vibrionivorans]TGD46773.1 hypothetical protein EP118_10620 [Halobacteriovorax sp. Y22]
MKGIILTFIFLSFALGHFDIFASSKSCPTGQTFNRTLNRCMYTEGSIKNRDEFTKCEKIEGKAQRQECMKNAADERQAKAVEELAEDGSARVTGGEAEDTGDGNFLTGFSEAWGIVTAVTSATVAIANSDWFSEDNKPTDADSTKKPVEEPKQPEQVAEGEQQNPPDKSETQEQTEENNDTCKSCLVLSGVSLYSFYQTKMNQEDVKKKTDEMKAEYEEISSNAETMKNAQMAAYDMLEKEQQYVAEVSAKQAKQFKTLALGYTAAAGVAVMEMWSTGFAACGSFKDSFTKLDSLAGWKGVFNNPCGVLVSSAVTVPSALLVSSQAKKNKQDAESNVEQVKILKEKYTKSIASFCPDGRDDLSNPPCYCYTSDGNRNPNREKSNTCQAYWNRYFGKFVATSDSSRAAKSSNPEGCIFKDGKFDRECQCRKLKNNKGENACMTVSVSPGSLSGALGGLDASEGVRVANEALQGNGGTYNASTSDKTAAMAGKTIQALKKKIEGPFAKSTGVSLDKVADKIARDLAKSGNNNVAIFNGAGAGEQFARLRPTDSSFQNALTSVEKNSPAKKSLVVRKQNTRRSNKKSTGSKWKFSNDSSSEVLSYGQGAGDGDSKKRYDYGDNDIIKDKSVSIFKVISHRYVQSGLKKLFEE